MQSLIEQVAPDVRYRAATAYRRVKSHGFEVGDLEQEAWVGVLEARNRYKADGRAKIATFVKKRIFGAIVDYIRHQIQGTPDAQNRNCREPADIASLDEVPPGGDEHGTIGDTLVAEEFSPEQVAILNERGRILVSAIDELPEQMRRVMSMLYCEEYLQQTVAEALGLDPSRISQIHSQAIKKLRAALLERYGREAFQF